MKRRSFFTLCLFVISGCFLNAKQQSTDTIPSPIKANDTFFLGKGINIGHWLSQQYFKGIPSRDVFFTKDDVVFLKEKGFQHLRIPIEEMVMWNEDGSINKGSFRDLDNAINWAYTVGMNVVLDLHIIKAHHFNPDYEAKGRENTLFTEESS
jgi:endoglucanase